MEFILFEGKSGQYFYPFQSASWDWAQVEAERKGWKVEDIFVDIEGRRVLSVIPPK